MVNSSSLYFSHKPFSLSPTVQLVYPPKLCILLQSSIGHFRVQNSSHFKDDAKPFLKKNSICMGIEKKTVSYQWFNTLHFETEVLGN